MSVASITGDIDLVVAQVVVINSCEALAAEDQLLDGFKSVIMSPGPCGPSLLSILGGEWC